MLMLSISCRLPDPDVGELELSTEEQDKSPSVVREEPEPLQKGEEQANSGNHFHEILNALLQSRLKIVPVC